MKFLLIVGLFLITHAIPAKAQDESKPIIAALQQGSSKAISKFLDDMVEIRFDNDKRDFSKNQAEIVLANFFKVNPVSTFKLEQQRKIDDENSYLIGAYISLNTRFRVLIKGKERENGSWFAYSLDFIQE
jgi:hypothetical protein